jgi:predicted DNA binding protein
MAVIVEILIPASAFDLGRVTQAAAGMHVELERVVPVGDQVMPFFWATGDDFETFEANVRDHGIVEDLELVAQVGDRALYHVEWRDSVANLTEAIASSEATIIEAHGSDPWLFRMRFLDRERLRKFHDDCHDHDIDIEIDRLYTLGSEETVREEFGTTEEQHEALLAAVEMGYFEVPRRVTLTEVASGFGISQQAASERVRRGANAVLRKVLFPVAGRTN